MVLCYEAIRIGLVILTIKGKILNKNNQKGMAVYDSINKRVGNPTPNPPNSNNHTKYIIKIKANFEYLSKKITVKIDQTSTRFCSFLKRLEFNASQPLLRNSSVSPVGHHFLLRKQRASMHLNSEMNNFIFCLVLFRVPHDKKRQKYSKG